MKDLVDAAKAVIEATDILDRWCAIDNLQAAVEQVEKPPTNFVDWFALRQSKRPTYFEAWQAAQQAERERIRARAKQAAEKALAGDWFVGPQHVLYERFVEELLEDGDE